MRRLPPLAAIRAFEAAARTENFTAAAAELGMTQAAVSYQVKSLEERLGSPLFVREKGRARLTPLGQRLLPALSSAFDAIEAAFASHREEDESLLTITTTHTFANTWLGVAIGGIPDGASRPRGQDDDQQRTLRPARRRRRHGGPRRQGDWEGMEEHRLFESAFTPMASPECIAEVERKLGRTLEPRDLPHQNLINPMDEWWQQWFADNGVPADESVLRRPGIRLENQANEGHAAMAGQGFAPLTPLLWKGDIAAGRLCAPFPDRVSTRGWAYWLIFRANGEWCPRSSGSASGCSTKCARRSNRSTAAGRRRGGFRRSHARRSAR